MAIIALSGLYLCFRAALHFNGGSGNKPPKRIADGVLTIAAAAALSLPIIQLVPLPPGLWQSLPGRETAAANLALVGAAEVWRPISIAPQATLGSLLALVPMLAIAFGVASLTPDRQRKALGLVVIAALIAAVLGFLQLVGGDAFRIYANSHPSWITGLHANRNAAADLFLAGLCAAIALVGMRERGSAGRAGQLASTVAASLIAVALVFTASRAGIILLVLGVLVLCAGIAWSKPQWRRPAMGAALALPILAFGALLGLEGGRIETIASRFALTDDPRLMLWDLSRDAVQAYWPWGTGMGTFVHAVLPLEALETVDSTIPNRAHNEYLELAIEGGVFSLLLGIILIAAIVALWRRSSRSEAVPGAMRAAALAIIVIFALHALVDYPLRNLTGLSVVGIALGILAARRPVKVWSRSQEIGVAPDARGGAEGQETQL